MPAPEGLDLDYAQPLATLLKTATAAAHESAEHSQGAGWLTRGELDKHEYVRFLMMLYHVYSTLEAALEKHSAHPALAPTHNPALLARAPGLAADIAHLLGVPESSWQVHPLHRALQATPPAPLTTYVARLRHLADGVADPAPLLAHAYVRYLGDLSGGQVIRRRIAKAYGLAQDDGLGTQFYDFAQLGGIQPANIGDMRKIKEWFRDGMNQGAGDEVRKRAIVEEAIKVFELNEGLFTVLQPPSFTITSQTDAEAAPLGKPSLPGTPTSDSAPALPSPVASTEKAYTLSSVLTFVLAVSIAHFALVVGGFTGEKGLLKLEAVQRWMDEVVHPFGG